MLQRSGLRPADIDASPEAPSLKTRAANLQLGPDRVPHLALHRCHSVGFGCGTQVLGSDRVYDDGTQVFASPTDAFGGPYRSGGR